MGVGVRGGVGRGVGRGFGGGGGRSWNRRWDGAKEEKSICTLSTENIHG